MITRLLTIFGIVATLLSLYWGYASHCPSTCSPKSQPHTGYLEYECAGKPHHSSWSSWWHPHLNPSSIFSRIQGAGTTTPDWNILYHLGGNGPWVEKVVDVVEGGVGVPQGCEVEQVHMLARHAERYPTKAAGQNQRAVVEKMKTSGITFTGNLAFFNNWTLFWDDDAHLEQLTSTGPFSGRLGAFTTGVRLRTRYQHLLARAAAQNKTTYWASNSQRVIDTARYFAQGFFGLDTPSTLQIISEAPNLAANTLTPGRTCTNNLIDPHDGKAKGYRLMAQWRDTYLPPIAARLSAQTTLPFSPQDIFSLQEICGFETTVRGRSEWCDVFTRADFVAFEYARDVLHFYRAGPGQRYAAAMGWLWLNATTELMARGGGDGGAGPLFFSFAHDGDLAPVVTALDVINDEDLPVHRIEHGRKWRKSQVAPMGGRLILEVLNCKARERSKPNEQSKQNDTPREHDKSTGDGTSSKFIRLNINDGITAFPDCHSGPGYSCPLEQFITRTKRKGDEVGDFVELCGLDEGVEGGITFLRQ